MQVGKAFADLFGLHSTRRIIIDIGLEEAVTVRVEFYPTQQEMEQAYDLVKDYHLMPAVFAEPETVADRYEYGLRLLEEAGIPIRRLLAQARLEGKLPPRGHE